MFFNPTILNVLDVLHSKSAKGFDKYPKTYNTDTNRFIGADFRNEELMEELDSADLKKLNFHKSNFEGVDLNVRKFHECLFYETNFHESKFYDSSFRYSEFKGANLSDSFFLQSEFYGSYFTKCNFKDAKFEASLLNSVRFYDCNLSNMKIGDDSVLNGGVFTHCNLQKAVFEGNMKIAAVTDCDLRGTDFSNARVPLNFKDWVRNTYNDETKLPDFFHPDTLTLLKWKKV